MNNIDCTNHYMTTEADADLVKYAYSQRPNSHLTNSFPKHCAKCNRWYLEDKGDGTQAD